MWEYLKKLVPHELLRIITSVHKRVKGRIHMQCERSRIFSLEKDLKQGETDLKKICLSSLVYADDSTYC